MTWRNVMCENKNLCEQKKSKSGFSGLFVRRTFNKVKPYNRLISNKENWTDLSNNWTDLSLKFVKPTKTFLTDLELISLWTDFTSPGEGDGGREAEREGGERGGRTASQNGVYFSKVSLEHLLFPWKFGAVIMVVSTPLGAAGLWDCNIFAVSSVYQHCHLFNCCKINI